MNFDNSDDFLAQLEARDNLRLIDHIADKIGLPKDQELSQEIFDAWANARAAAGRQVIEECANIADTRAAEEDDIFAKADRDNALTDRGRWAIQDRSLGRNSLAQAIAKEIRALALPSTQEKPLNVCPRCGGSDPDCYICGTVVASTNQGDGK
jgi:hypothetical protein